MILLLYAIAMLALGWILRRDAAGGAGYFLAGRKLSGAVVGYSLAATGFSGSALLLAAKFTYEMGIASIWYKGPIGLGFFLAGALLARRIRRSQAHSLVDFIARRHGEPLRRVAAPLLLVVQLAFLALTIKSFATLCTPILGAEHWLLRSPVAFQAGVTALIVAYIVSGGHKAVAITDVVQLAFIALGLFVLLLPAALLRADFSQLPAGFLTNPFPAAPEQRFFPLNMLILGLAGMVGGDVFSKLLSARDEQAARRGGMLAGVVMFTLSSAVVVLALAAKTILPPLDDAAMAIPMLARAILPPVLFELMTLALLSVLLSTASSVLMTATTVMTLDILRPRGAAAADDAERGSFLGIRVTTILLGAAGFALALGFQTLLSAFLFGYTLLTATLVVPVLFSLALERRRPCTQSTVLAGMLAGLFGSMGWALAQKRFALPPLDPATIGVAASALAMLAGTLLTRSPAHTAGDTPPASSPHSA